MAHEGDVIEVLTTDHREVEEMFRRLEALPSGDPARREITDQVIAELVRHSVAEETYVYPSYRSKFPDGDATADEEIAEHAAAEETMKALDGLSPSDPKFDGLLASLMASIRGHITEEEGRDFPRLRAASTQAELDELAAKVNAVKQVAPTRPHPAAPDNPVSHKLAGPALGLVDRVRDGLSGRSTG